VVTYQSPAGRRINLTGQQEEKLKDLEVWPKDEQGGEYCSVYHGEHGGHSSYGDQEFEDLLAKLGYRREENG
ncbi:MAG: hypothetical protein ACRD1R_09050, partial [Acidobacteriota bacterium]